MNLQTNRISELERLLPSKPDFKEYMLNLRRKAEAGTLGKLAVLELFAGIGAPHSALSRVMPGCFEVLDVVEIWSTGVMAYNVLYGTNYDPQDVREWFWEFDIRFDLVFHGSPCQDFSQAGNNKGGVKGSGTRSATLWETDDIIRNRLKKRPKVVIWENVKGALSGSNRPVFDAYLGDLKEMGYITKYAVLNSKDFGIPQNRNRVFAVSILDEFAYEFKDFDFAKLVMKPYLPAKYYLETEVDEKYFISETAPSMVKAVQTGKIKVIDGIVQTVTTKQDRWNSAGVVPYVIETQEHGDFGVMPNGKGDLINGSYNRFWETDKAINTISASVPSKIIVPITGYVTQDKFHDTNGTIPTIGTGPAMRPNIIVPITNFDQQNRIHDPGGVMPAIGADNAQRPRIIVRINDKGEYSVDRPIPGKVRVWYKGKQCHIRRITERESFRFMDFKDYQFDKVQTLSSNSLYKMAGNSIVVSVLTELFDKLFYNFKGDKNTTFQPQG